VQPGLVRINGLFRHGWLIAPGLVETALETAVGSGFARPTRTPQETP
jgi:glycine oxidase